MALDVWLCTEPYTRLKLPNFIFSLLDDILGTHVTPQGDVKTARLKAAVESAGGTWREAASMSEVELSSLVRSDGVDVLIELTGHTAHNRLGVMAMRPAPVQVCTEWLLDDIYILPQCRTQD